MINLIDIERRYHHLEGDFCDITSCISLWGILRKNLRKRSTYINLAEEAEVLVRFFGGLFLSVDTTAVILYL